MRSDLRGRFKGTSIRHFCRVYFMPICFMPICFYKRTTLVPVFTNWKKSEEGFSFYEERLKVKVMFRVCFAGIMETVRTSSRAVRMRPPGSFPRSFTQHQASVALNCACEHLCFISICALISKMCPKVIASLLLPIQ